MTNKPVKFKVNENIYERLRTLERALDKTPDELMALAIDELWLANHQAIQDYLSKLDPNLTALFREPDEIAKPEGTT